MDPLPHPGPRVVLRRLRPGDLDAFLTYRADPEVGRYQGWAAMSRDAATRYLTACATDPAFPRGAWWQVGVARVSDDRLIGDLGFHLAPDGDELELGVTLAREAQGAGLAEAAVRAAAELIWAHTPARRIVVITDARNADALALIERLGLAQVDVLHEQGFPEPVFHWTRPGAE